MTTQTKKISVSLLKKVYKIRSAPTFFQLAQRNIIKKKKVLDRGLSKNVDKIVYGV